MAAAAPAHAGMTWLLSLGKNRNLIHPLAGLRKSCNFAGSWSRTRNEKPVDYQDVRGGRKDVPSSDNRLTPLF